MKTCKRTVYNCQKKARGEKKKAQRATDKLLQTRNRRTRNLPEEAERMRKNTPAERGHRDRRR